MAKDSGTPGEGAGAGDGRTPATAGSADAGGDGEPRNFDGRDRFGGYLNDYRVGDVYRHWPGKTITEAENHLFCLLTMAVNPLHTDSHFVAKEGTVFARPVVVGSYVYSLLLGMSVTDMSGRALANLGTDDLRHLAPVYPGDTIYARSTVTGVRVSASRHDAGVLTFVTEGINQDGRTVARYTRSVLLPRRPA